MSSLGVVQQVRAVADLSTSPDWAGECQYSVMQQTQLEADDLPNYRELMLPVLRAVDRLGGSATNREVVEDVLDHLGFPEEAVAIQYPTRAKSILVDRVDWARS
jgi:hypothetical protein